MPKSLDPARASSAPETDIIRAIYEGLTVLDPATLDAVPGVAESWKVSDDGLEWRFELRETAKWSNGRAVTAGDFVRSWQRIYELGEETAHRNLLNNFAVSSGDHLPPEGSQPEDFDEEVISGEKPAETVGATPRPDRSPSSKKIVLGISTDGERTLIVRLKQPDKDLAKLVSHPIFMPVFGGVGDPGKLNPKTVANGPFRISEIVSTEIILDRSKSYWNSENVKIERLRFVPIKNSDDALEAYRSGEVDALTNTEIAPLAQKVFSTASDFRKNVFGALNFYEINFRKAPFSDRRVREALAISIERDQLLSGDGETTIQAALSLLPFGSVPEKLVQDKERARELLEQAGFPEGRGFAPIRLTVNRNEVQLRIARAVARMWKENLNVETILDVRENEELAAIRESGQFDIVRRGVVFPVPDELVCISAIYGGDRASAPGDAAGSRTGIQSNANSDISNTNSSRQTNLTSSLPIFKEADALHQIHVIPLYFPRSFALVKPYVRSFELTSFDAPNLTATSIDSAWQPVAE